MFAGLILIIYYTISSDYKSNFLNYGDPTKTAWTRNDSSVQCTYIINITTHFIFYLSRFWMDQHMGASKKNTENDDMFYHKSTNKIKLRTK